MPQVYGDQRSSAGFCQQAGFLNSTSAKDWYGAASPKPTTFLVTGVEESKAATIELAARTTPMPMTTSIGRENGQWRTSKLKEYPPALCDYIARLFQNWLVRHSDRRVQDFESQAAWLQELIVQEDAAVQTFGPDFAT